MVEIVKQIQFLNKLKRMIELELMALELKLDEFEETEPQKGKK